MVSHIENALTKDFSVVLYTCHTCQNVITQMYVGLGNDTLLVMIFRSSTPIQVFRLKCVHYKGIFGLMNIG